MSPDIFLPGLHLLRPLWLLALPLLWGLTFWLARRQGRDDDWSTLIDADLLPALRLEETSRVRRYYEQPWPWLALLWTLSVLALAGPSWQQKQSPAYRNPAAWVFVLDLSPSMATADLSPDRVTRARYALEDLLGAARDARVALVVFSDESYTVTPLTQDVATVRALLPPLAPEIMPSPGDQLAPALEQALKLIEQVGAHDKQVVVLSDGFEDQAAALTAAARLKAKGVKLTVLGFGTPGGAPLRDADGRFAQDAQGKPLLARLDAASLRQVAETGGGRYVDPAALAALITDMQAAPQWSADAAATPGMEVTDRADGGIWLLPILLLLTAVLGRRGWL